LETLSLIIKISWRRVLFVVFRWNIKRPRAWSRPPTKFEIRIKFRFIIMDWDLNNKIEFILGIQEIALWTILIHLNIAHIRTFIVSFSLDNGRYGIWRLGLPFHCDVEGFIKTFIIMVSQALIEGDYGNHRTHLFIFLYRREFFCRRTEYSNVAWGFGDEERHRCYFGIAAIVQHVHRVILILLQFYETLQYGSLS